MSFVHHTGPKARDNRDVIFSIHDVKREGSMARVSFSPALLKRLGWSRGDMLTLGVGFGADESWAELRRADNGTRLRAQMRGTRLFWQTLAPLGWPVRMRACAPSIQVCRDSVRILLPWKMAAAPYKQRSAAE